MLMTLHKIISLKTHQILANSTITPTYKTQTFLLTNKNLLRMQSTYLIHLWCFCNCDVLYI